MKTSPVIFIKMEENTNIEAILPLYHNPDNLNPAVASCSNIDAATPLDQTSNDNIMESSVHQENFSSSNFGETAPQSDKSSSTMETCDAQDSNNGAMEPISHFLSSVAETAGPSCFSSSTGTLNQSLSTRTSAVPSCFNTAEAAAPFNHHHSSILEQQQPSGGAPPPNCSSFLNTSSGSSVCHHDVSTASCRTNSSLSVAPKIDDFVILKPISRGAFGKGIFFVYFYWFNNHSVSTEQRPHTIPLHPVLSLAA